LYERKKGKIMARKPWVAVAANFDNDPALFELDCIARAVFLWLIRISKLEHCMGAIPAQYLAPGYIAHGCRISELDGGPGRAQEALAAIRRTGLVESDGMNGLILSGWNKYQINPSALPESSAERVRRCRERKKAEEKKRDGRDKKSKVVTSRDAAQETTGNECNGCHDRQDRTGTGQDETKPSHTPRARARSDKRNPPGERSARKLKASGETSTPDGVEPARGWVDSGGRSAQGPETSGENCTQNGVELARGVDDCVVAPPQPPAITGKKRETLHGWLADRIQVHFGAAVNVEELACLDDFDHIAASYPPLAHNAAWAKALSKGAAKLAQQTRGESEPGDLTARISGKIQYALASLPDLVGGASGSSGKPNVIDVTELRDRRERA
jgi:hypothetical protein